MKRIFISLITLAASASYAQEADLMKAFQREYSFLAAQKESLLRDQRQSQKIHMDKLQELESQVALLEREIVKAGVRNDSVFEELQELERKKKEQRNRDSSLQAQYKKSHQILQETMQSLNFQSLGKIEPLVPDEISIADFNDVKEKAIELLRQSSSISEIRGAYKNRQGDLVEGPIVRFGRIAAHAVGGGQRKVLGPNGEGLLAELDVIEEAQGLWSFYLFENLMDKAVVKKKAGILDRFADALPIVILGLMFTLVGALFLVFARE